MSQFSFHYVCIITILCPNLFHHTFSTFLLIFKHYHQLFQKSCLAFLFCFETGTHSVAQSGFKFMISFFWYQGLNSGPCVCQTGAAPLCYLPDTDCMIFSPQPPECWGYSHGSSFLAFAFFFFFPFFSFQTMSSSSSVAQGGLEFPEILLPLPHVCWYYRRAPPLLSCTCLVYSYYTAQLTADHIQNGGPIILKWH